MNRRTYLAALALTAAGCSTPGEPTPTPTEESAPTQTPAAADRRTPANNTSETPRTTETPGETTTAPPTDTPTPEPTPDTPERITADIGTVAEFEIDGTPVEIAVYNVKTTDTLSFDGCGGLEAPAGYQWATAQVYVGTGFGDPLLFGHSQWRIQSLAGVDRGTDSEAMRSCTDAPTPSGFEGGIYPDEERLRPIEERYWTLIFAVEYEADLRLTMHPYGRQEMPVVEFVP